AVSQRAALRKRAAPQGAARFLWDIYRFQRRICPGFQPVLSAHFQEADHALVHIQRGAVCIGSGLSEGDPALGLRVVAGDAGRDRVGPAVHRDGALAAPSGVGHVPQLVRIDQAADPLGVSRGDDGDAHDVAVAHHIAGLKGGRALARTVFHRQLGIALPVALFVIVRGIVGAAEDVAAADGGIQHDDLHPACPVGAGVGDLGSGHAAVRDLGQADGGEAAAVVLEDNHIVRQIPAAQLALRHIQLAGDAARQACQGQAALPAGGDPHQLAVQPLHIAGGETDRALHLDAA
ncbi:TrbL/VirB6 plasmid conjugal transfer protein, partial [Dysosmobacter welbionis]